MHKLPYSKRGVRLLNIASLPCPTKMGGPSQPNLRFWVVDSMGILYLRSRGFEMASGGLKSFPQLLK
jgi:hypothetical protein